MKQKLPERRRFIRVETPLKLVISCDGAKDEVVVKNISPVGLLFELSKKIKVDDLKLSLTLPSVKDPISIDGKIIWQTKQSLEDEAAYDVGVEIVDVEDKSKNVFLQFLCDLLYSTDYKART